MSESKNPMHAPDETPLSALQSRMSAALLAGDAKDQQLPPEWFAGPHPGAVGLRVHRNTVLAAIGNALRLSYVAVERLVGEEFFDRMAIDYARLSPPSAPQLDLYGEGFAAHIDGFPGTEGLPYLSELAKLDWQVAALGRLRGDASRGPCLRLEGGVQLQLASPMRTLVARFAVDQLRSAILSEDLDTLRHINLEPAVHPHVLWRSDAGVNVRAVSAASARFIDAALAGSDGAAALEAAAAVEGSAEDVASLLAREILPAGFVRVQIGEPPAA